MAWRDAGITARLTRIEVSLEGLVRRVEKSLGDSQAGDVWLIESGLDGERETIGVFSTHEGAVLWLRRLRSQQMLRAWRIVRYTCDGPEAGSFITEAFG
jgi:hypothetical protein